MKVKEARINKNCSFIFIYKSNTLSVKYIVQRRRIAMIIWYVLLFFTLFNNYAYPSSQSNTSITFVNNNQQQTSQSLESNLRTLPPDESSANFRQKICQDGRDKATQLLVISHFTQDNLKQLYRFTSNQELFDNYSLYAAPRYLTYIRTLQGYEEHMLTLSEKINNEHKFRKKLRNIVGFPQENSFANFVNSEAQKIRDEQVQQKYERQAALERRQQEEKQTHEKKLLAERMASRVTFDHHQLNALIKKYEQKEALAKNHGSKELQNRYKQRITALRLTLIQRNYKDSSFQAYDYSHSLKNKQTFTDAYGDVFNYRFGTALDKQIHEELVKTRAQALELYTHHPTNLHAQILVPSINYFTALAKTQTAPHIAFDLSDFANSLVQVLSHGMEYLGKGLTSIGKALCEEENPDVLKIEAQAAAIIGRGLYQASKNTLDPQRWKDMITGTLKLGFCVLKEIAQEELRTQEREQAMWHAVVTGNTDHWYQKTLEHHQISIEQEKAIHAALEQTKNRIKAMSWEQLLEKGVELGATLVFDIITLQAASHFASLAGRELTTKTAEFLSKNPLAEEYLMEVAGAGKIALEDGTAETNLLIATLKENNFAEGKLEQHFKKHVIKKMEWGSEATITSEEYLKKAQNLLNSQIGGNIEGFISHNGWIFKYNKTTNEFLTAKPDGTIETLFRPKEGVSYWLDQIEKYKPK